MEEKPLPEIFPRAAIKMARLQAWEGGRQAAVRHPRKKITSAVIKNRCLQAWDIENERKEDCKRIVGSRMAP